MLRLNSINQLMSMFFYDNKSNQPSYKSLVHFKPNVNYLRSTQTYTSYFLLFFYVTKYYKLVVYASGDSTSQTKHLCTKRKASSGMFTDQNKYRLKTRKLFTIILIYLTARFNLQL